jgi:ABC-type lipoprotein export system ATPase subunit
MTGGLFECRHVSRTFGEGERAVVAVHDVTCRGDERSRVAVVGPSGSGKSTLIHLLAGLDQPTSGSIDWPGLGGRPSDHAGLVGVVFQAESLVPALTAQENIALPLVLRGVEHGRAQALALRSMRRLRIEGLASQLPDELSGGQAQRVAVARVVSMEPRLILADEPTGRLDRESARAVVNVLVEAAGHLGAGLVIATHDPGVTARMTTRWRMRDGELADVPSAELDEVR